MARSNRRLIVNVQRKPADPSMARKIERQVRKVLPEMLSTRLLNTIRVTVKLRATVLDDSTRGQCHWRDMTKGSTARSKHYTITIQRDLDWEQMRRTLTHELAHIEQMARGRLAIRQAYGRSWWCWRPVGHTGAAIRHPLDCAYWTRPWEVEARAAEVRFHGKLRG